MVILVAFFIESEMRTLVNFDKKRTDLHKTDPFLPEGCITSLVLISVLLGLKLGIQILLNIAFEVTVDCVGQTLGNSHSA